MNSVYDKEDEEAKEKRFTIVIFRVSRVMDSLERLGQGLRMCCFKDVHALPCKFGNKSFKGITFNSDKDQREYRARVIDPNM